MTGTRGEPRPGGEERQELAGQYAGRELGLPPTGPGSMATLGRRFVAILVDWVICQLIATFLLGYESHRGGFQSFIPLAVFAVENLLLVATTGSTVGHRLLGLQVQQARAGLYPVQVLVRTVLLCLFIPAVFSDRDGRGFHDRLAGTVIVRR